MKASAIKSLDELIESEVIELTRGKIISRRDMLECPGSFPVYSSAKENGGKFGEYGKFMFDEELITWSVDGGGKPFYRPRHKFSVTNVGGVLRIRDSSVLDYRYLHYVLSLRHSQTKFDWVRKAHPSVIRKLYRDIPLPPLPEQRRVVAILDETFVGLGTATANAEKNLKNARELFDSVSKSLLQARNENWQRLSLEALLERGWIVSHLDGNHGNDYPRKEEFISSGVPYLSANCLENNSLDMSLAKFLSPQRAASLRKGVAQNNDVLFAHNATVGPVAMLYTNEPKVILSTSLTYYRCHPDHIVPEYLAHYMRSPEFRVQYEAVMRQSTRNQVPITKQREFFHVIPPLDEQRKIAKKLDTLLEKVTRVDASYLQRLTHLSELKQALLQRAFSGELTPQPSQAIKEAAE